MHEMQGEEDAADREASAQHAHHAEHVADVVALVQDIKLVHVLQSWEGTKVLKQMALLSGSVGKPAKLHDYALQVLLISGHRVQISD